MLHRLAVVIWWIGLLVGGGLIAAGAAGPITHRNCDEILGAQDEANRVVEARIAAVDAELVRKGLKPDPFARALGEGAYSNVPPAKPSSDEARGCRSYKAIGFAFMAGAGATFLLIAWSLTFVLGGSFLRPPRAAWP